MKTPTVTIIFIDFGTCQIRYFSLRYLHTRLAAHKKKSKTCTFGGAGIKERETYLKICLFVGLWNYFQRFTEINSTSSAACCYIWYYHSYQTIFNSTLARYYSFSTQFQILSPMMKTRFYLFSNSMQFLLLSPWVKSQSVTIQLKDLCHFEHLKS